MPFRALDVHAHFRTGDRAKESGAALGDASRLFGTGHSQQDPLEYYRSRQLMAVVFDVDSETTDGLKPSNEDLAALAARSDGLLLGFGTVDPWKGAAALAQLRRFPEMGLKGVKFQPITQAFFPNDERFYPIWETCELLKLPVVVHMGTTAIGASSPGGRGLRLKYARPVPHLDDVAAQFPDLKIIAAHPGWPWHVELLAVARHKQNVFIDLSGWAPRYFPPDVVQYFRSVMPEKFLYGSDYPLFQPDRWFEEFAQIEMKPAVRKMILYENACKLLGVDPDLFGEE